MVYVQEIGYWVQTVAFIASAVFAGRQLQALRRQSADSALQSRRRATIDAVIADSKSTALNQARRTYVRMKQEDVNFNLLGSLPLMEHESENHAILDILNNYEFMATGIAEGAFDESIYRRMKRSLVISDWQTLEIYIIALRKSEDRSKLFCEFEALAKLWSEESDTH